MKESLFPEYVQKWFNPLVKKVKETINGTKEQPKYMFKSMLKEVFSTDLKWGSLSSNGSIVAADIVTMNSSLPLKRRDSMGKATGDIPKAGMKLGLNEKQLSDIDILKNKGDKEAEVVAKIFSDVPKVVGGVEETIEYMFLTGLSNGSVIVPSDKAGVGIRADFGHPESQKFGVQIKYETGSDPKALDDIQNVLTKAKEYGVNLNYMLLDGATLNIIRQSSQVKSLFAASLRLPDVNNAAVPLKEQFKQLMLSEYNLNIIEIDRTTIFEKNGKKTSVRPWAEGSVAFLSTLDAGELQYGELAEENHPVTGVAYQKATSYTLVSKYAKNDPLEEFTTSQALVIPVIDVDNLWLMDTNEAQALAAGEIEGDANITIWDTALIKADVVVALNDMGIRTASNISDAKLIEKVNTLSDEQEAELKELLGV